MNKRGRRKPLELTIWGLSITNPCEGSACVWGATGAGAGGADVWTGTAWAPPAFWPFLPKVAAGLTGVMGVAGVGGSGSWDASATGVAPVLAFFF